MITRPSRDSEFSAYVAEQRDRLLRTAYLLSGDWARAEDVTQIALSKLYLAWHRVEQSRDAYARQIVVRAAVDERRRPWRREVSTPDHLLDAGPAREQDDLPQALVLRAALLALPPRQRQVVVLRFYQDLSVQETAEILAVTTGTVKSTCARALLHLNHLLSETTEDGIRR
ncbi:SigE family RNA polymerase sigma factor [uncultured Friedmanniella sp.]|uniref:SigE family RNA polymerase sigma factor n=1 Tax=uncultured Friedmanniella sp. TaxID=335381 RepID=UPI0035CA2AE5